MNNHFKVLKDDQLTLADELIYSLLSCYSDKDGVSNISRQSLANKSGIKKLDTITAHTNKLEELGLISKSYTTHGGKKLAHYKITNPQQNFMWVSNEVTKLRSGLIGFLVKLASLRWKKTDEVRLSNNEIISKMKVSKSTFYRDIDELLQLGIVIKKEEGYSISTELFPVFDSKEKEMIRKLKSYLDESANNDEEYKKTRLYHTFYYYYNKGFEGLDMPISDFITQLTSGFFFKNKPDTDSNKKEQEKRTIPF